MFLTYFSHYTGQTILLSDLHLTKNTSILQTSIYTMRIGLIIRPLELEVSTASHKPLNHLWSLHIRLHTAVFQTLGQDPLACILKHQKWPWLWITLKTTILILPTLVWHLLLCYIQNSRSYSSKFKCRLHGSWNYWVRPKVCLNTDFNGNNSFKLN